MNNYFSADVSIDTVANAVLDDGYAVVEKLAPETTSLAGQELQPHLDQAPFGHTEFLGGEDASFKCSAQAVTGSPAVDYS